MFSLFGDHANLHVGFYKFGMLFFLQVWNANVGFCKCGMFSTRNIYFFDPKKRVDPHTNVN